MSVITFDRHGQPVAVGDEVKVLAVTPDLEMDEDDLDMFYDMVGSTCVVERIDRDGAAWVAVWWNGCEGTLMTQIGLAPQQMEKVAI